MPTDASASPDRSALPADLIAAARALAAPRRRRILGITGPPGSGKSTVAASLAESLGSDAVVVGMDGFHLANAELERLGRRHRKGAPDTFDAAGYVALLQRVREQTNAVVYAPRFDRAIEESLAGAVPIHRDTALIITEGNYLLLDDGDWAGVAGLLDETWYLEVDHDVRLERLIARHLRHGKSEAEARAWTLGTDERNAWLIAATRDRASRIVHLPDGD